MFDCHALILPYAPAETVPPRSDDSDREPADPVRYRRRMPESPSEMADRFRAWMQTHDNPDDPADKATPAATVLVLRDSDDGLEVLMLQRNARGEFASAWVFPGGKVDPEDFGDDPDDVISASRRAAIREANEEADLVIADDGIEAFSHWMPPTMMPRRFATWFFATMVPPGVDGDVMIDGGEIVDDVWVRPADALERHRRGEVELFPPTWITLHYLSAHATAADVLAACRQEPARFYVTDRLSTEPVAVCWHGDVAYGGGDPDADGPRHRLTMQPGAWAFQDDGADSA